MRVVFMGTPEYGVPSLKALIDAGYQVVGVFTQPDRPSGRGKKLQFSPVKQCAVENNIPVYQPAKIRVDGVEDLRALQPDVCVTAAFGQILSQEVLDIPKMGTVNVHASLLPEYRGSSPINWCLLNGEKVTGVTTMLTDKGIDTGDILQKAECVIEEEDTTATLTVKLAELGAGLLIDTLKKLENGTCPREKQDESKMSYYPMLKKEMGLLDFNKTAQQLVDQVRAFDPWPCAYLMVDGAPMKVWKAAVEDQTGIPGQILCANAKEGLVIAAGEKALKVVELQAQGGKRMRAQDYLRGHALEQTNID